jgi:hypothetical protein
MGHAHRYLQLGNALLLLIQKVTALVLNIPHQSMICKAENTLSVTNDEVIKKFYVHIAADKKQGLGQLEVLR